MKRLSASITLVGVLVGVPLVLLQVGGAPALPSFDGIRLNDSYMPLDPILKIIALLAWTLWTYLAAATVLRTLALLAVRTTGSASRIVGASCVMTPRPFRAWIDLAVGGALLAATINPRFGANVDQVAQARQVTTEASTPQAGSLPAKAKEHRAAYLVRDGDSLWRIAERKLGSGFRWREIFELNRGKTFDGGQRLRDPRLIRPGWTLELPTRIRLSDNGNSLRPRGPLRSQLHTMRPTISTPSRGAVPTATVPVRATDRPVLRLPSGLVIATSFASGLLSAEMLGLLRRRRRFRPLTDSVEPQADCELLQEIRSTGATTSSSILEPAMRALTDTWRERFNEDPPIIAALERERRVTIVVNETADGLPAESGGSFSPRITFRSRDGVTEAEVSGPFPLHVDVAVSTGARLVPVARHTDASVLHVAPFGLGAMSAEGPGGAGAALQALFALATRSSPEELEIVLLGIDDELRAAEALPHVTRSVAWEDAADVLRDVQAEFLRRARSFFQEGVEGIRAFGARRPDERLSGMLIVAEAPPQAFRGVIEAAAVEAPRVGAAILAVGWKLSTAPVHAFVSNEISSRRACSRS
jgi:hypothetical protein